MTIPDAINGSFEALAGLMIGNHCRTLHKQKQVRGVSLLSTCFFGAWGIWNLYYYPHLGQIFSFLGGLSVSTANAVWIAMMIYYRRQEKRYGVCPGAQNFVNKARGPKLGSIYFVPEPGQNTYLLQKSPGKFERISRADLWKLTKGEEARNA